jgi:hypothetical protein
MLLGFTIFDVAKGVGIRVALVMLVLLSVAS